MVSRRACVGGGGCLRRRHDSEFLGLFSCLGCFFGSVDGGGRRRIPASVSIPVRRVGVGLEAVNCVHNVETSFF